MLRRASQPPDNPQLTSCYSSITNFVLPTARDLLHDYIFKCGTHGVGIALQAKNNASHLKNETAGTIRFHLVGGKRRRRKIWSHLTVPVKGLTWRLTPKPSELFVNSRSDEIQWRWLYVISGQVSRRFNQFVLLHRLFLRARCLFVTRHVLIVIHEHSYCINYLYLFFCRETFIERTDESLLVHIQNNQNILIITK